MSKASNTEQVVQLERQLQDARRSKGPFDASVHHVRSRLRSSYEGLLLERTSATSATSAEACEEALQGLWRLHYKHIEEYRTAIRRLATGHGPAGAAGQSPARAPSSVVPTNGSRKPQQQQQQQAQGDPVAAAALAIFGGVPQTVSSFVSFVTEASGFYHELMGKLKAQQGLPYDFTFLEDSAEEDGDDAAPAGSKEKDAEGQKKEEPKKDKSRLARKVCRIVCHRCLIYLGDLARYREQASTSRPAAKDWSRACSYYQQAAAMVPWSGNPHNQLAVLGTYVEDEFLALYHYYRSLALALPFPTASENLKLAFDLNLKKYPAALQMGKAPEETGMGKEKEKNAKQGEEKGQAGTEAKRVLAVRRLMTHMVRVNGIIATKSSLSPFGEVYLEAMKALAELLGSSDADLPTVLALGHKLTTTPPNSRASEASSAAVALRMMALLIYTLHCLQKEVAQGTQGEQQGSEATVKKPDAPVVTYSQALQRTMLMRHAVLAIFEFAGRIIQRVCATEGATSVATPGTGGYDALLKFTGNPLVPAVALFLQWLAVNPSLLVFVPPSQSSDGAAAAAAAASQAVDREQSARLFLWGQCRLLLNLFLEWGVAVPSSAWSGPSWVTDKAYLPRLYLETLSGGGKGSSSSSVSSSSSPKLTVTAVWEDLELRGFEPLLPAYQAGTVAVDMLHVVRKEEGLKDSWGRVERMVRAGVVTCALQPRDTAQAQARALQFDMGQGKFYIGGAPSFPVPAALLPPPQQQQQQQHVQAAVPSQPQAAAPRQGSAVAGTQAPLLGPRKSPTAAPIPGAQVVGPPGEMGQALLPSQKVQEGIPGSQGLGPGGAEGPEEEDGMPAWAEEGLGAREGGLPRSTQAVDKDFLEMSMRSQQQERDRRGLQEASHGPGEAGLGALPNGTGGAPRPEGVLQDDDEDEVILFRPAGNAGGGPARVAVAAAPALGGGKDAPKPPEQPTPAASALAPKPGLPSGAPELFGGAGDAAQAVNLNASSHSLFSSPSLFSSLTPSYSSGIQFGGGGSQGMDHLAASGSTRSRPSAAGIIGQQRSGTGAPAGLSFSPPPGGSGAPSAGPGLPEFLSRDPNLTQFLQHNAQGFTPQGAPPAGPGGWAPGSSRAEPSLNLWLAGNAGPGVLPQEQRLQLLPPLPPRNPFDQFTHSISQGPTPNSFVAMGAMGPMPGAQGPGLPPHIFGAGAVPGAFLGQPGPPPLPLPQGVPGPASAELLRQLLLLQQQQRLALEQHQPPPPPGET